MPAFPAAARTGAATIRVAEAGPGTVISPFVYGSNEVGTLDGGRPSAELDRLAGVTARRFGGNLTTTYNWTNNASNAGKDDRHANGAYLSSILGVPDKLRRSPASAIVHTHQTSLGMGAVSVVTLPVAGFVAADDAGPVLPDEAAPSRRFVPVRWTGTTKASDPIDPHVADIPQLLRRLTAQFGSAADATGIRAYALDNEPGLWAETHPRIVPRPARIEYLLRRSIVAARAIKAVDPDAWVIGPASWGATELATFQNAPDWAEYRRHGSFVAAYLDAFRRASEETGRRLLDALDVHWYPFSRHGELYRSENPALAPFLLDAPRSLTEAGFREDSWVSRALSGTQTGGVTLPLLPSLAGLAREIFPGTRITVSEFNYGGAGQLASGLALADALGRFGQSGALLAHHWGSLDGWLMQAYRLFRNYDDQGGRFGDRGCVVEVSDPALLSAFAAEASETGRLHVIAINKAVRVSRVELVLPWQPSGPVQVFGFDEARPRTASITSETPIPRGRSIALDLPARSARHYVVELAAGRLSAKP